MVGTPLWMRGLVSVASPSSSQLLAFRITMYLFNIICTISLPRASPLQPKPSNFVLPQSLQNATICLESSSLWISAYTRLPLFAQLNYSPLQAMNLKVRFGLNPLLRMSLRASKQVMKPPPSSLAPVCDPVSQESICPPKSKIQSGFSAPLIQKTTLLELALSIYWLSRTKCSVILCPLSCILCIISASSTVMQAAGMAAPRC